jgi:release factor glutamine methyltransferase
VATRNASKHSVSDRVTFLEGDLFSPLPAGTTFDFILSNPPYIAHEEMTSLAREVREFEPRLALDGGSDGLAVIARLVEDAGRFLKPGGYLLIEIGYKQEAAGRSKIEAVPGYEAVRSVQDHAGHPRVLVTRRSP